MATLGIKINASDFAGSLNYNESWIHGFSSGDAADVPGSILVNGTPVTVPNGYLFNQQGPSSHYIVFDTSGANFVMAGQADRHYVHARNTASGWEYDPNGSWTPFTPTANHVVIGKISVGNYDTNVPPGILEAVMFETAINIVTDSEFNSWLKSPSAARCVLVDAEVKTSSGVLATRHLSTKGYVTDETAWPSSTNYAARITGGLKFTRNLSLEGLTSLSSGDIELINTDGALDAWLDDYWVNRTVTVSVGDASWHRINFRPLYVGTLTGIDSRKRDRVNLKLSDLLQRLNAPASEAKLGGSSTRADDLLPLCFGECHNVAPVLIDSTVNEYMVHNGAIEDIIEVRDNGVPVAVTKYLSTGKFRLNAQPAGTITASVQGAKIYTVSGGVDTYSNKVADIIFTLAVAYGNASTRLSSVDIDMPVVVQFNTDNPQPVGVYLQGRENVLDICNQLATSVGARLCVNTSGRLSIVKLALPWAGSTVAVGVADMVDRTLEPKQMVDVVASVKVGYCKNWTVQAGLTTGIVQEHVALYGEEWLSMTATSSTAATNYNLFTDPVLAETNLLVASDALAEANRRLGIYSTQRKVMKFTGMPYLQSCALGSYMTLTHPRFGLASGKVGQVLSVSMDIMSPQIEFEVLL